MPYLHQYDYIMAIGTIFATLDAFMIGANDVANSFATSVSSKSLTMKQACIAAAVFEFLGGVLVGARTADTIKSGIIKANVFQDNAGMQMLTFTCALVASSTWLTLATRMSWPVSTTYSIVSAIAGAGVALGGWQTPNWGWNGGKGLATIFAGLAIAPGISAGFGAIVYLLVKYVVLIRKNPTMWGLYTSPFFFFVVTTVLTLSIIYKGSPQLGLNKMSPGGLAAATLGSAAVVTLLSIIFWLPFVHARVVKKDYTVRYYHFFLGPALWWRQPPVDAEDVTSAVPDYRIRKNVSAVDGSTTTAEEQVNDDHSASSDPEKGVETPENPVAHESTLQNEVESPGRPKIEGSWILPRNLIIIARHIVYPWMKTVLTHGSTVDIHALQAAAHTKEAARMQGIFNRARQYPNDTEHLYSFMQVMTACTASFAHGANDLSNAIGPFAVIYQVWSTGDAAAAKSSVPVWALAYGGIALVIGLATYGYNIMAVLGNRITLHSPSRGFSMELGAAITVILASQYGLPVSSTMCITGATVGVSLCNGDWRSTNWRAIAWIFFGWVATVPIAAIYSGCLLGIIINAPRFGI